MSQPEVENIYNETQIHSYYKSNKATQQSRYLDVSFLYIYDRPNFVGANIKSNIKVPVR